MDKTLYIYASVAAGAMAAVFLPFDATHGVGLAMCVIGAGVACWGLRGAFGGDSDPTDPTEQQTAYDLEPFDEPTEAPPAPAIPPTPTPTVHAQYTNGQVIQFLERCCTAVQRLNLAAQYIPSYQSLAAAGVAVSPNQRQTYLRLLRSHIIKVRAGNSERWVIKRGTIWQLLTIAQRGALRLDD